MKECPFCSPKKRDIISDDTEFFSRGLSCYARWDKYPVSEGHILICPFKHSGNYNKLEPYQIEDMDILRNQVIDYLDWYLDKKPDGYNIGINIGEAAGQTVDHVHMHIIPRYKGDVKDPTGGVRGVIPSKQNYKTVPFYYYDYDHIKDSYSIWKQTESGLALIGFKKTIEEVKNMNAYVEFLNGRNHLKFSEIDKKLKKD